MATPVPVGATLYQIVFTGPAAHVGDGSFVSVVAPELSFVSVKLIEAILIAFAKLSFAGGGATTMNVGNVTVDVVTVVPPPGGGFCTPAEFVLPKLAIKLAGTVAVSCVALTKLVAIAVPVSSGLRITLELATKFVPTTVITVSGEFTGVLVGDTLEIVGAWPSTVNGKEFVVFGFNVVSCTDT